MTGLLSLCGTPIGNLEDITLRALRILREADIIAAEDTRVTRRLLSHYDIHPASLLSYREDNQAHMAPRLLQSIQEGARVALVTDAGMPGISDPGAALVANCREAGVEVEIVPGPSSVLAGLVASGFSANRFVFEGFLPRRGADRQVRLAAMRTEARPTVILESPHRMLETLEDLHAVLGERRICMARELTKKFEEVRVESIADLLRRLQTNAPRGEFTLVVEGATEAPVAVAEGDLDAFLRQCQERGLHAREASETAAAQLGVQRKVAYQRYLQLPPVTEL